MTPFPDKKYQIIYADPPWMENIRRNPNTKFGLGSSIFPLMEIKEICQLPVKEILYRDCALFLWTTNRHVKYLLTVMDAWGFKFINKAFCWVKINKDGTPRFGIGNYTKSNTEDCWLGIKGRMKVKSNRVSQIIEEQIKNPAHKPDIIRHKIIELFGDLPRIELFARPPKDRLFEDESYKGWDLWGNEV